MPAMIGNGHKLLVNSITPTAESGKSYFTSCCRHQRRHGQCDLEERPAFVGVEAHDGFLLHDIHRNNVVTTLLASGVACQSFLRGGGGGTKRAAW